MSFWVLATFIKKTLNFIQLNTYQINTTKTPLNFQVVKNCNKKTRSKLEIYFCAVVEAFILFQARQFTFSNEIFLIKI